MSVIDIRMSNVMSCKYFVYDFVHDVLWEVMEMFYCML